MHVDAAAPAAAVAAKSDSTAAGSATGMSVADWDCQLDWRLMHACVDVTVPDTGDSDWLVLQAIAAAGDLALLRGVLDVRRRFGFSDTPASMLVRAC